MTELIPIEQIFVFENSVAVSKAKICRKSATEINNLYEFLIGAHEFCRVSNNPNAIIPTNFHDIENFTDSPNNKLYNCPDFIHQQRRVRSVVRISRRSSEPQVMGSKPTGPVNHMGSNNSWLYNTLDKRRYNIAR